MGGINSDESCCKQLGGQLFKKNILVAKCLEHVEHLILLPFYNLFCAYSLISQMRQQLLKAPNVREKLRKT